MNIDRTRLLMLTSATAAAIAAAAIVACSSSSSKPGSVPTGDEDASTSDARTTPAKDSGASDGGAGPLSESGTCDDNANAGLGVCADSGDVPSSRCLVGHCGDIVKYLKPKIASKMIDCLTPKSGADCVENVRDTFFACAQGQLGQACSDPTAQASCNQIATACAGANADAGITTADCNKLLQGMTQEGRTLFVTCMIGDDGVHGPCGSANSRGCTDLLFF